MKNNLYSNHKLCDQKGRRCSVFIKENADKKLNVFVIKCSPLDSFDKILSKKVYTNFMKTGAAMAVVSVKKTEVISIDRDAGSADIKTYMVPKEKYFRPLIADTNEATMDRKSIEEYLKKRGFKRFMSRAKLKEKTEGFYIERPRRTFTVVFSDKKVIKTRSEKKALEMEKHPKWFTTIK